MDIISRLKRYMDTNDLSSSRFADAAGIPRPTLSQLLNGRGSNGDGARKVSSEIIKKIHDAFPSLNIMWLLFGDGDMDINENIEISEPQIGNKIENETHEQSVNQPFYSNNLFDDQYQPKSPEKIEEPVNSTSQDTNRQNHPTPNIDMISQLPSVNSIKSKKVESIMVFYSDNSFEIFKPSV